jgi:hypothetical protein
MQRLKRRLSSLGSWKGSIFQSFGKRRASAILNATNPGEVEIQLAVWLCMIRSSMIGFQSQLLDSMSYRGYKFKRQYTPIDRVIHAWMLGILYESSAISESDACHEKALPILTTLIELMINESCEINDYRVYLLFLTHRLNVYVELLACGVMPTHGLGLDCLLIA